ncbi:hypothetical protein LZ198_27830 [Myxococcus sp. K15C18031901]|uniref:hypothetical protein n=1 Tax=Myxococcus dinghuensis TaxID=2906761 RepID=UPI0020A75AEA|nr:hypothetical protein [Myxococcus dinghuensis]MCP3102691.1 hypothetical protein [Myxococcus dinghuensis]
MRTSPPKKLSLMSEREAQLVLSSAPGHLSSLTRRELRGRVLRARKLVDKYEDLALRQRREALRKQAPRRTRPAEGNKNTLRKAAYFRQALERFEKRLEVVDRQGTARAAVVAKRPSRAQRRAAGSRRGRAATARRTTTARGVTGKKPVRRTRAAGRTATVSVRATRAQRKKGGARKQQRFGSVRRTSHGVARNRRTQARRDSRR